MKTIWLLDDEMKDCPDKKTRLARVEDPAIDGVTDKRFIPYVKKSQVEIMLAALKSIAETPTSDSTGNIQHRNTWTDWAKTRARIALSDL